MTSDVNVVISHSEYTVLVVDDVVSNVLLLKVLLTNEKFKVITAGTVSYTHLTLPTILLV